MMHGAYSVKLLNWMLKTEVAPYSAISVCSYQITRRYRPADRVLGQYVATVHGMSSVLRAVCSSTSDKNPLNVSYPYAVQSVTKYKNVPKISKQCSMFVNTELPATRMTDRQTDRQSPLTRHDHY